MSRFTTRIELYGSASEEVYNKLHSKMDEKEFKNAIDDNGNHFRLPKGEYVSFHGLKTLDVVELARQIAESVWDDVAVFVTSSEVRWEYHNLKTLS